MKHGYTKGLNKDLSPMKVDPNSLYHALNVHLRTDDGDSTMALINGKGNVELTITDAGIYDRTGYVIINVEPVRSDLVIFWAKDDDSGYGIIDKLIYQEDESYVRVQLYRSVDANTNIWFQPNQPLAVAVNYRETHNVSLYVTGENYGFSVFDVGHTYDTDPLLDTSYKLEGNTANSFRRIPHASFKNPTFEGYSAGNLLEGVYQYAYRAVTKNNIPTIFSPASLPIPVSSSVNAIHTSELFGPEKGGSVFSGVGVSIGLDLTAISEEEFDYVEIASLYYTGTSTVPTINLIERVSASADTVIVVDESNEGKYGSVEYTEFVSVLSNFSASHLNVKDNRLFAANIKSKAFDLDFDARAFRWNSTPTASIRHHGVDYPITKTGTWPNATYQVDLGSGLVDIPEDFDCINTANQNDLASGGVTYQYQSDGTTFGAEGVNIKYEILDYNSADYPLSSNYMTMLNNPTVEGGLVGADFTNLTATDKSYALGSMKSFRTQETYRFGLVFFNELGETTPVKWVGDIFISEPSIGTTNAKFIKFYVNLTGTSAEGRSYQIVYEQLTDANRRVITEGIIDTVIKTSDDGTPSTSDFLYTANAMQYDLRQLAIIGDSIGGGGSDTAEFAAEVTYYNVGDVTLWDVSGSDDRFVFSQLGSCSILSPESCFGLGDLAGGVSVRLNSTHLGDTNVNELIGPESTSFAFNSQIVVKAMSLEDSLSDPALLSALRTTSGFQLSVDDSEYLNYNTSGAVITIDGVQTLLKAMCPLFTDGLNTRKGFIAGNQIILATDTASVDSIFSGLYGLYGSYVTSASPSAVPLAYVKCIVFKNTVPYFGDDYRFRLNGIYTPASDVTSSLSVITNRGDVTVSFSDLLKTQGSPPSFTADSSTTSVVRSVYGVFESVVNGFMQYDKSMNKGGGFIYNSQLIQGLLQTVGSATGDLYKYNEAIKLSDSSRLFAPVDSDFQASTHQDTMIRWSEADLEGSGIDQMAVFKANNYKLANNSHGPINALTEFKDTLFIHQDTAFASVGVNTRATQVASDGSTIVLGQGNVVDNITYISTDIGSQKLSEIITSAQAIYWLDRFKKKLYSFNGRINTVSLIQGLSGFFKNTINNTSVLRGAYDIGSEEVLLSVQNEVVVDTTLPVPGDPSNTYVEREVTKLDNRYGVLALISGVDYRLSSLAAPFVFSFNVEYEIAGGVFVVTNIDYDNHYVDFELIADTPTLGLVDVEQFIRYPSPFTLSFDEQLSTFSSFWSFIPTLYVNSNQGMLSSNDNFTLYSHNSKPYNSFYGVVYDSYFDIIIANDTDFEALNVEAYVHVEKDGEYLANKGIYSVKVWTNGQESDELVLYPKDTLRYIKDSEGTRLPNQGITIGAFPYSTLYNASKNADKVWRFPIPRIREDLVFPEETVEYRNRALGVSARVRFKLKALGDNTRFVVEDVNIIGEIVKL